MSRLALVPAALAALAVLVPALPGPAQTRLLTQTRLLASAAPRRSVRGEPDGLRSGSWLLGLPGVRTTRRLATAAVVLSCPLGLLVGGPGAALLFPVLAMVAQRLLARRRQAREADLERRRVVAACSALASELRAGRAASDALRVAAEVAAGPAARALRAATSAAQLGGDVSAALREQTGGSAVADTLLGLAACWQVCTRAGSGLAAAVEQLAEGVRSRQEHSQAVAAALAGPQASAALLAVLPLAGILLAAGLGARPLHLLFHTAVGLGALVLGTGLDLLGLWWTGRIVEQAVRAAR